MLFTTGKHKERNSFFRWLCNSNENLPVPFAPNNHFKGLTCHGPAYLESQVDFVIFPDSQKSIVYEVLLNAQCPFCNIMPVCPLNSSLYLSYIQQVFASCNTKITSVP